MGATKDRAMSAALKAFALSIGRDVRTAQRHRKSNSPEWQRYMANGIIQAMAKPKNTPREQVDVEVLAEVSINSPRHESPPPDLDESAMSEPERMMRAHWQVWQETHTQWKRVVKANGAENALLASSLGLALTKHREAYIKAKRDFEDYQQRQRLTIPNGEIQAARQGFWIPFFNLLRNMPAEISAMCDPAIRADVRKVADEFLVNRLQPQSHQILDDLDNLTPALRLAA